MKPLIIALLLLLSLSLTAQESLLHGRVISGDARVPEAFVINKTTGAEVKTDGLGNFILAAKPGNRVVVYSPAIEVREFLLSAASFAESPYLLEVQQKATELSEVTVSRINPETLGIVPKGQKQYTVAERRVKTAGEFKPEWMMLMMGGISIPVDPIINAITGRTKMLKEALATERREFNLVKIGNIYTPQQITTQLHIPEELVEAFIFYAAEDADCLDALRKNNKDFAKLRLMVLAEKYLSLQKE